MAEAAALLRRIVTGILDDHPDAVLQLTGGIDSRILLAAVPRSRRAQLTAMTLQTPGNADPVIAGELASRYGMRHELISFEGLDDLSPEEAFTLCLAAARRLDGGADPLAAAAVDFAERLQHDHVRLGSLGSEVARASTTRQHASYRHHPGRIDRRGLADLREQAAPADAFFPRSMPSSARSRASVRTPPTPHRRLVRATDHFYLHQRMRRWAGTLTSATSMGGHPEPDARLLRRAGQRVAPRQEDLRFLARLLIELDPFAAIPWTAARPVAYASSGPAVRIRQAAAKI